MKKVLGMFVAAAFLLTTLAMPANARSNSPVQDAKKEDQGKKTKKKGDEKKKGGN